VDSCLAYLLKISDINSFSDEGIKEFEAHYYQAATQSGYYGYRLAPYKKYLHYLDPNGLDPSATFPPKSAFVKPFDSTLNAKVANWLAENGNNIIYIYGGITLWCNGDQQRIRFVRYEEIFMEISQKFRIDQIDQLATQAFFKPAKRFYDAREWFIDALWCAV
jgi:hypothetical protein